MFNRYRSRLRTKTTSIAASNPFVLDQISTPSAAAYSLRKLRGAYTGNAVRVRRSSDNTELDVGFASISQNLAVNGDFSNGGTGWTLSNASVSSGVLNVSGGADFIKRNIGLVQGKKYWFSFNYTCSAGANLRVNNGNANGSSPVYRRNAINGTSGKIQGSFIATTTSGFFAIEADANTFTGTIDNIIVCEVGLAGNDLDLYALSQFCAPSGGSQSSVSSGLVSTWYDQSGFARHATQVTAGNQPRIVNAGVLDTLGGKPTVVQVPAGAWLELPAFTGLTSVGAFAVYAQTSAGNGSAPWWLPGAGSGLYDHMSYADGNAYVGIFSTTRPNFGAFASTSNVAMQATATQSGTALALYRNGTQIGTAQAATFALPTSRQIFGVQGNMSLSELILTSGAPPIPDRQNIERNQGNYYGIAIA